MLTAQNDVAVRHQLLERISDARRRSDALFSIVRSDSMFERPIPERHRIIFYVGHLEAFDWNLLHENVLGLKSFHPEFDRLFAFGIDPVGGGLPSDQPSDWPSLDVVQDYVGRIRAALDEKLADGSLESASLTRDGFPLDTLLNVAIEHRLMHVETLAYMLHQLPLDRKISPNHLVPPNAAPVEPEMIQIPAGVATLGLRRADETFGWDNEYERALDARAGIRNRSVSKSPIGSTWNSWLQVATRRAHIGATLIGSGKRIKQSLIPFSGANRTRRWLYRSMFEEIPLPLDWPVYVSHAEASAYARWAGKSLPTEEQWHRAAYGTSDEAVEAVSVGR